MFEKGYKQTKLTKLKISKARKGLKASEETKRKLRFKRRNRIGKKAPGYKDGRTLEKHYCVELDCNNGISYQTWKYGNGRCLRCFGRWESGKNNPNFGKKENSVKKTKRIRKIFKTLQLKPNKPEKLLNKLLQRMLPNEYKYVGNGQIIFCGFNPDFINCNGQKKIVELYGDYWHNKATYKERDKRRLIAYRRYGYKTLIIWQHELRDLEKIKTKIKEFHYGV